MAIHPTAIIDPSAELAADAVIGPRVVIGPEVVIGSRTEIMTGAVIDRWTRVGADCRIFPGAILGAEAQDFKYSGERTELVIGDGVTIREMVTAHRASGEGNRTEIGDGCYLMALSHVAHNCRVGKHVVMANYAGLAGHVEVGDRANFGAYAAVHQFARVGEYAFLGGYSRVTKDMPPYMIGEGTDDFRLYGPNTIGLKRLGFSPETVRALKDFFRLVCRSRRLLAEVLSEAETNWPDVPEVRNLVAFMRSSSRGVYR